MSYSLLSRFRGTLVGVAIAASQWEPVDGVDRASRFMLASAQSLIRSRGFNAIDWQKQCGNLGGNLDNVSNKSDAYWAALVPIALFYHDDESHLAQQLQQVMSLWPPIYSGESDIMILGWAIAHILKQGIEASTTIPHLLNCLEDSTKKDRPLADQTLKQVSGLLAEYANLETATDRLNIDNDPDSATIALALYCFLSSAQHFQLSVGRAVRTQPKPHLTALLTGALSGAYNGCAGIAIARQISKSPTRIDLTEIVRLITVADRLFASWMGVYDVPPELNTYFANPQTIAVTAPDLLRHHR